jgi:hypothetical protein
VHTSYKNEVPDLDQTALCNLFWTFSEAVVDSVGDTTPLGWNEVTIRTHPMFAAFQPFFHPTECMHVFLLTTFDYTSFTSKFRARRKAHCVLCFQLFKEIPERYFLGLDISPYPALPVVFPWSIPNRCMVGAEPLEELTVNPALTMFDFYKEPLDWDDNHAVEFHHYVEDGLAEASFAMQRVFRKQGLPYLHCGWDVNNEFSQRDRYAKLIRLALGKNDSEPLPGIETGEILQWYVRGRRPMEFHPLTVPGDEECGHFFGLSSFNYRTRNTRPPAPGRLQCSFCGFRSTHLPTDVDYLMDFGCAPPIPMMVVELCYVEGFNFQPDEPVPPLPFGNQYGEEYRGVP